VGVITERLSDAEELTALKLLDIASSSWVTLEMTGRVLDRASARFPEDPVRTLDALHLATALMFHEAHGALTIVSLDERIRDNATALGLSVAP
jgi:predicted nucleic acid-binding protein